LDELDVECSAERDAAFAKCRSGTSSSSNGSSSRCSRGNSEAAAPALSPYDEAATSGSQLLDMSVVGRQVVVELKTSNALPLLKYACSNRTVALPTSQLNAQRVSCRTTVPSMRVLCVPLE
jgi:hypothetical protein